MKKYVIVLLMSFVSVFTYGQIQTVNVKGATVIIPSLENILAFIDEDNAFFKMTMAQNNYKLTTDGSGYCAASSYFTYYINKETAGMIWSYDQDFNSLVSNLRREIKNKTTSRPVYSEGFEFYMFKLRNGAVLKIGIQEGMDGSSAVLVLLE